MLACQRQFCRATHRRRRSIRTVDDGCIASISSSSLPAPTGQECHPGRDHTLSRLHRGRRRCVSGKGEAYGIDKTMGRPLCTRTGRIAHGWNAIKDEETRRGRKIGSQTGGRDGDGHGYGWQWDECRSRSRIISTGGPRGRDRPTLRALFSFPSPFLLSSQSLSPLLELRSLDPAAPSPPPA